MRLTKPPGEARMSDGTFALAIIATTALAAVIAVRMFVTILKKAEPRK